MTEQELRKNLKDRRWRLNNLYWIKDDQGNEIRFKLNWVQKILLDNIWFLNIILKARQLGITTFFCLLDLDDTIFNGYDSGLIAHTLPAATKIFDTKVKYAWDKLPEIIKKEYKVNFDNIRELKFTKKIDKKVSSIYVGTSLRSGTVQRLHISELGTMDQKYPNKSEEIKAGALNTVHKGQIVTIESTAKGQTGIFYDMCKVAMANQKMGRELTEMDYMFFFFPWWKHSEYQLKGNFPIPKEIKEYFEKIRQANGIELTQEQKNWYFKKWQTQRDSMKSEFPSTPEEAFLVSIEGAYFGKQLDLVMEQKRITSVPWQPLIPVDTWWDIGTAKAKKDSNSIIFTQDVGLEIHIIDFYGASGEGLAHYKKVLDDKPYVYGRHYGPHDLMVKELGTGKTRYEMAGAIGIKFDIVPKISFSDGIEAARMVMHTCWFDEEKTAILRKALGAYRKEWDDRLGKFKDKPLKNWAADPSDAFRLMAIGHKEHQKLGFYDKEEEEIREIKEREALKGKYDPFNPFGGL